MVSARRGDDGWKLNQRMKRKRKPPGTPNPAAEVIALSPRALGTGTANKFFCGVCNRGFVREQNLQLHRKGHRLPYTLERKSAVNVRKKVYVCPEPTCVHHHPSRALGDLTGIKKHFFRKHGEKTWNCDYCDKKYAVESDLKAHIKTCKESDCECSTNFARHDKNTTHGALCDNVGQESPRNPNNLTTMGKHLYGLNNDGICSQGATSNISSLQDANHMFKVENSTGTSRFEHLLTPSTLPLLMQSGHSTNMFQNWQHHHHVHQDYSWKFGSPHISPTGLLPQQANQLGSDATYHWNMLTELFRSSSSSTEVKPYSFIFPGGENDYLQGYMNPLVNRSSNYIFGGNDYQNGYVGSNASFGNIMEEAGLHTNISAGIGGSNQLTLDFLGVGGMFRNDGSAGAGGLLKGEETPNGISFGNVGEEEKLQTNLSSGICDSSKLPFDFFGMSRNGAGSGAGVGALLQREEKPNDTSFGSTDPQMGCQG